MKLRNLILQTTRVLLAITIFIALIAPVSAAKTEFFPLDKVQPGMNGYGLSVFSGTKVERFDFRVVAVIENTFNQKLILVRLDGKPIQECGGLAAGMSGSPVYIDQRLVGSISYGLENGDPFLALVTPIESMLKVISTDSSNEAFNSLPVKVHPVVTPVVVSGMGERGFELLRESLAKYGLTPVNALFSGKKDSSVDNISVQPGGAIAVQMVSGDVQISAVGTVTYVNKKNFLAFGHPFMNRGAVDYPVYNAYIYQTVKSHSAPFKLGGTLNFIGRIVQDRKAGIYGRLGETPSLIPVVVNVEDTDRRIAKQNKFQVIDEEQFYRDLIVSGTTDAIDRAIDRVGSGTAKVTLRIDTADRKESLVKENIYFGSDIAAACLGDLRNLLDILANNEFAPTAIKSIRLDVQIQKGQNTARIVKIESEKDKVKPGDSFWVNVTAHSFRGEVFTIPFEVKLPGNIEPGKLYLTVRGGGKTLTNAMDEARKKEGYKIEYKGVDSLNDLINQYLSAPKNGDVILEFTTDKKNSNDKPNQQSTGTSYYMVGEAQVTIDIQ